MSAVPKVQLNLDELVENDTNAEPAVRSIVAASIKEKVEDEKCVVASYRTTLQQKNDFMNHLSTCHKNNIPIEWVIDIADESNGWFYGTAYHFDDSTQMLHVMVPDKLNPTFDGKVLLDHRTVHVVECVDGKSDALFNKIVRDSVIKVKWDVEWFEENPDGGQDWEDGTDGNGGTWVSSSARYYIRIANQLLVEDKDFGQDTRGFVILTADLNVRLLSCHKGRGAEDFHRLINESTVQSSPEAAEAAQQALVSAAATPSGKKSGGDDQEAWAAPSGNAGGSDRPKGQGAGRKEGPPADGKEALPSVRKLTDMSRGLRECLVDVVEDRERAKKEQLRVADMYRSFALEGDLDQGLQLVDHFEGLRAKAAAADRRAGDRDNNEEDEDDEESKADLAADDAMYLSTKLERSLVRVLRGGSELVNNPDEEIELLRRGVKKLKKELEERDKELFALRAAAIAAGTYNK